MKPLGEIYTKYGCDKGPIKHQYHSYYTGLFEEYKEQTPKILEIGIFKGASAQAHREYLQDHAILYGIDDFHRIDPEDCMLDGISWKSANSTQPPDFPNEPMDIIIDDGKHTFEAQKYTFLNYFPLLSIGGTYVIEDVWPWDKLTAEEKQHPWLQKHKMDYNDREWSLLMDVIDKSGGKVTRHDFSDLSGHLDSHIIEVRK